MWCITSLLDLAESLTNPPYKPIDATGNAHVTSQHSRQRNSLVSMCVQGQTGPTTDPPHYALYSTMLYDKYRVRPHALNG